MNALVDYSGADLALIKRTVAKDCNDDEFRLFIHLCRATRLDPLRKQAYAFVYSKDDPKKRQLTLVTAIAGYRTIADRTGAYRPDEDEPQYHYTAETLARNDAMAIARRAPDAKQRRALMDEAESSYPIDPLNPLGIERVTVKAWKHVHGDWHKLAGEAWWTEFVPIKEEWAEPEGGGKSRKTGRVMIDPKKTGWIKMPRLMIAKVAEAMALRKGWPDDFSAISVEEETHREESRFDAIEAVNAADEQAQLARIGKLGRTISIDLGSEVIEPVPVGQFADRCIAFIEDKREMPTVIDGWRVRNRHALREFHALEKADALAIKRKIDEVLTGAQERQEADSAHGAAA